MSQKKKTTKLNGWLPGYPFQGDRLGRQQIRKALTTQARPGHTSRRENVPTFGRDGRSGSPTGRVIFCCVLS